MRPILLHLPDLSPLPSAFHNDPLPSVSSNIQSPHVIPVIWWAALWSAILREEQQHTHACRHAHAGVSMELWLGFICHHRWAPQACGGGKAAATRLWYLWIIYGHGWVFFFFFGIHLNIIGLRRKLTGWMLYAKRMNCLSADTWNLVAVRSCAEKKGQVRQGLRQQMRCTEVENLA